MTAPFYGAPERTWYYDLLIRPDDLIICPDNLLIRPHKLLNRPDGLINRSTMSARGLRRKVPSLPFYIFYYILS